MISKQKRQKVRKGMARRSLSPPGHFQLAAGLLAADQIVGSKLDVFIQLYHGD